jgi:DNA-binding GntR family transcriptional regulator
MSEFPRLTEESLNVVIYLELRQRLVTGRLAPGSELSTRGLAAELGVSQTPVRDALSRLAADGAVAIRSKRRIQVPQMTRERFDDLLRCRLLLEPEAAAHAVTFVDVQRLQKLRVIDAELDRSIREGDTDAYVAANHAFHFGIYSAQPGATLLRLIEMLWLQVGPFMRLVHGRLDTRQLLNDQHQNAMKAIAARNAEGLREAIAADIADGMRLVARAGFAAEGLAP